MSSVEQNSSGNVNGGDSSSLTVNGTISQAKTTRKIESYFTAMTKLDASDLHLKAGSPPHFRLNSILRPTKAPPITSQEIEAMSMEILTPAMRKQFQDTGSADLAYQVPGGDRYRINIFRQRNEISLAARRVKRKIPNFSELNLPEIVQKVSDEHQGLVLLSGPTGSGKSTTIAAMLEFINQTRACHVVTMEDPIEYLYDDKKCIINQREIGIDVPDFASALKYVLREDPDIILVGEMRDHETFQTALQAAETGHLVFGTVHASTAPQTIGRILDLFPAETRDLIRQGLAFNLRGIICQKLLPSIRKEVGRVPAVEILLTNPMVRTLIHEGRDTELTDLIRAHEREGMISFTSSLLDLIDRELIDPHVAYEVAPNVDELKMRMKGINIGSSGGLIGRS